MKRETRFLKLAIIVIGSPVLALCLFWVPGIISERSIIHHDLSIWRAPAMIGLYVTAMAFFIALFQAFTLLRLIDKEVAFSMAAVNALRVIMICAITISMFYIALSPLLYVMAELEDAPGLLAIGLVILFASMVIAGFAAVLKKLLQQAIEIKSENDLTV